MDGITCSIVLSDRVYCVDVGRGGNGGTLLPSRRCYALLFGHKTEWTGFVSEGDKYCEVSSARVMDAKVRA